MWYDLSPMPNCCRLRIAFTIKSVKLSVNLIKIYTAKKSALKYYTCFSCSGRDKNKARSIMPKKCVVPFTQVLNKEEYTGWLRNYFKSARNSLN